MGWFRHFSAVLAAVVASTTAAGGSVAQSEHRPSEAEIGAVEVYATPEQAIAEIFGAAGSIESTTHVLAEADQSRLIEELGAPFHADTVVVLSARGAGGELLGYGVVDEEIGKYRPITFLVGTEPDLQVRGVEVLVYRESRGGEVRKERFLRQYVGKSAEDPIRTHRDVLNIAGATLSVRALNVGVKRVLTVLSMLEERGELVRE